MTRAMIIVFDPPIEEDVAEFMIQHLEDVIYTLPDLIGDDGFEPDELEVRGHVEHFTIRRAEALIKAERKDSAGFLRRMIAKLAGPA